MNNIIFKTAGLSILLLAGAVIGTATAAPQVLTGKNGMAMYTFDKDAAGKSTCLDDCAATWPPAMITQATSSNKVYGEYVRPDHSKQLTFRGKPVYFFSGDQQSGDVNGDNIGGVWHVIREIPTDRRVEREAGSGYGSYYSY